MKNRGLTPIFRRLALAAAIATGVAACGYRTPVRPPEDTAAVIPGAVETRRDGDAVIVRWKRAERSADGMRLDDLAAFIVERRRAGEDAWTRIATIDVVDQEKIRRRKDFSWRDEQAGTEPYEYRIIAIDGAGEEGVPTAPTPTPQ
jgi:hypothetical protein